MVYGYKSIIHSKFQTFNSNIKYFGNWADERGGEGVWRGVSDIIYSTRVLYETDRSSDYYRLPRQHTNNSKPLEIIGKMERHFYDHLRTS